MGHYYDCPTCGHEKCRCADTIGESNAAALDAFRKMLAAAKDAGIEIVVPIAKSFTTAKSFTCPDCGMVSHHPGDVEAQYCAACHSFPENRRGA